MIEETILSNLVLNDKYCRAVIPFIKDEYFADQNSRTLFQVIKQFMDEYQSIPNKIALMLQVDTLAITEESNKVICKMIDDMHDDPKADLQFLIDSTEKYCQDRAIFNAIKEAITIIDGHQNDKRDKGSIPAILSEALSVSFDTNIGHDFLENYQERYDFYHKAESKLPFDLDMLNKITKGGLVKKSLNVILAGTGVGKTLFMTHTAASHLKQGKNVLYITMEMAEEKIAERIDANLLNITIDELQELPKESYVVKMEKLKSKLHGRLIVKEYPTSAAGAGHFRHLLNELKLKKGFVPDVVYIDYINICSSSRLKLGSSINSYLYVKAIAEEIRALAIEFNTTIITATQTNREGFSSSDPGLENTSESFGLPATADLMFALVTSEELDQLNQLMVIQLKNRYNDLTRYKRFVIGIDRPRMKLYDCENSAQDDLMKEGKATKYQEQDRPVMDKSSFGERWEEDSKPDFRKRGGKRNFSDLKIS